LTRNIWSAQTRLRFESGDVSPHTKGGAKARRFCNSAKTFVSIEPGWRKIYFPGTRKPLNWQETGLARGQLG
jgi:hypothetical protein